MRNSQNDVRPNLVSLKVSRGGVHRAILILLGNSHSARLGFKALFLAIREV